jgi:hypothetical protein
MMEPATATITNTTETPSSNFRFGASRFLSGFMDGVQTVVQIQCRKKTFSHAGWGLWVVTDNATCPEKRAP